MPKVLVLQNARLEGPGTLGDLFESEGFELDIVYAKRNKVPNLDHDAVLVLGAPQSANDDLQYLKDEMALIGTALRDCVPVLGICLGSQLIAKALGANVYRGPRKEIGFYRNVHLDDKTNLHLFDGMSNPLHVFHWHGDTFDLPKGADRLAFSDLYTQAFRYGSAVALQFHLEVTGEMVESWLDNTKEDLAAAGIDSKKIRCDLASKMPEIQKNMKIFFKNFGSEFGLLTKV